VSFIDDGSEDDDGQGRYKAFQMVRSLFLMMTREALLP
jgi:hypothetical protein